MRAFTWKRANPEHQAKIQRIGHHAMAVKSSSLFASNKAPAADPRDLSAEQPVAELSPRSPALLALASVAWLFCAGISTLFLLQIEATVNTQITFAALLMFAAGVLLALICAWPVQLHVALRNLRLGPWLAVAFSVVFGLATLVWLLENRYQSVVVDRNFLIPATFAAFVGVLAAIAMYKLTPSAFIRGFDRIDTALRGRPPVKATDAAVLALWLVGIAGRVLSFMFGGSTEEQLASTSSLTQVLATGAAFGLLATLLAGARFAANRSLVTFTVLAVVLSSQLVLGFYSSSKQAVWIQLFAVAFGYATRRRIRVIPTLAVALVAILFVVPFQTAYRTVDDVSFGSSGTSGIEFDVSTFAADALEADPMQTLETTARRLSRIGDLALILQKTPSQVEYSSPVELLGAPLIAVIPRSFWPEKPVLDQGRQMSIIYYELPTTLYTASAMTPYGDLWRHGGVIPLILGMAALGFSIRLVDGRRGSTKADPRILFLPMLLFAYVVKAEASFIEIVAAFASVMVTAALASRLVTIMSGGADGSSQP